LLKEKAGTKTERRLGGAGINKKKDE